MRMQAGGDGPVDREALLPFAAKEIGSVDRTIVSGLSATEGEAIITDPTNPPQGVPSNATKILVVDYASSAGTDQSAILNKAKVGDPIEVTGPDGYLATIALYIDNTADNLSKRFWFDDAIGSKKTLAWDQIGTGAATVKFYRLADEADEVATDTTDFDGVLSSADSDVQAALETLDDLRVRTKQGVMRSCSTELSGATTTTAPGLSLLTASYTPSKPNARLFVRLRIACGAQGNSNNDYVCLAVRVKRGTGNYRRIDDGANGYTEVFGSRQWQYNDTVAHVHTDEFPLVPPKQHRRGQGQRGYLCARQWQRDQHHRILQPQCQPPQPGTFIRRDL